MADNKLPYAKRFDLEKRELDVQKKTVERSFDSHWHDYFEIKLILDGRGTITINGDRYELKRGCLYFVMPANIHTFRPETGVLLYNVSLRESVVFDESIIQKLSKMSELFFQLSEDEFARIYNILGLLEYENEHETEYRSQMTRNLLECLLLSLIRKSPSRVTGTQPRSLAMRIAVSYMKIHFRDNIKADAVASILGFSTGYFSTLFHKTAGVTFVEYLNDMRLEYAKKMLGSDQFTISEIGRMSGFQSYSNFLKAFKKKYGVLPKDFRSNLLEKKEILS